MSNKINNPTYLRNQQYRTAANLTQRIALHEKFSTNPQRWSDWIFRHLAVAPGQKILAVGCGNATQWQENAGRFPVSVQITLMDLSLGMVRDAREGIAGEYPRFVYLNGDGQFLPFPSAWFDRVTANHMLYHLPSIDAGVAACARVLKPEGLFIAATNGARHMTDLTGLLNRFTPEFTMFERSQMRFGLQNGAEILRPYFAEVCQDVFVCDLWVTDPQPLVDYAFSMWDVQDTIAPQKAQGLHDFFAAEIEEHGGILIRKETGVFLACHTPGLLDSLGLLGAEQELS